MDNDDAALTTSTPRRPSTAHDRPVKTPGGPRLRTKSKHNLDSPSSPLSRPDSPMLPRADAAVQVSSAPTSFVAPPPLPPPPTISFEPTPIPWKGLSFEVAQWSLSSTELQEIVSRAIRLSARESFVRLLPLQAAEVEILQEAQRLHAERAAAQAKWRFEVARRTMLLHALNATVASSPDQDADALAFISQLASSIASSDALLASLVHLSDQQSQVALLEQQHWASALAVALRKLNKSYERQSEELRRVQHRVRTLEDELEEAWHEAEKMAIEFDELEQDGFYTDDDEPPQPDSGVLPPRDIPSDPSLLRVKQDMDDTATVGDMTINTDIAVVLGVTATAVVSKATLVHSPGSPKPTDKDKSDAKSVRSVKSTRSRRSRDGPTHLKRLSSARARSRAASNASLRLPKALRTPTTITSPDDAPPIPALPDSFLDMDAMTHDHRKGLPPPRRPEPSVALPTPPHSAGLPPTRVPSIWVETDAGKSTRLNGLDRSHSLHIFSSLTGRTAKKSRRSNLVMSLTGTGSDSASPSPVEGHTTRLDVAPASPVSPVHSSPVSLPSTTHTHGHFHHRGPSGSTSSHTSLGPGPGVGSVGIGIRVTRPGSAGARLADEVSVGESRVMPRRSLVSRASSVILRRLSAATMGSVGKGSKGLAGASPAKTRSREAVRLSVGGSEALVEDGEEGEVMLIGSPYAEPFDDP